MRSDYENYGDPKIRGYNDSCLSREDRGLFFLQCEMKKSGCLRGRILSHGPTANKIAFFLRIQVEYFLRERKNIRPIKNVKIGNKTINFMTIFFTRGYQC